jgi:hypothetical protein
MRRKIVSGIGHIGSVRNKWGVALLLPVVASCFVYFFRVFDDLSLRLGVFSRLFFIFPCFSFLLGMSSIQYLEPRELTYQS